MSKHLYILLLLAALLHVGCADDVAGVAEAPSGEAPTLHRDSVPLAFEASLASPADLASPAAPASRAEFDYGALSSDKKGLALSWSERDVLGVYIKTADNTILRAGSISSTGAKGDESRTFSGAVLQKFEGEQYIYLHPDLGRKTYVNLEQQEGRIGSTEHLGNHLPIVWKEGDKQGKCLGYVIHLTLDFNTTNPGNLKKVTLLTQRRDDEDRIFPRHYSINNLLDLENSPFDAKAGKDIAGTPTGLLTANTDYTHAITLNLKDGGVTNDGDGTYSAEVFLTSAEVENLNLYYSKIYVQAINEENQPFASDAVSFKGQSSASDQPLLSEDLLTNGKVHKMTAVMSEGTISPTIISSEYKINSILGMWNEYGKPYDPNGLVFYKTGFSGSYSSIPQVLIQYGNAIHDRYTLTDSKTGTPTFTMKLYDSQNSTCGQKQDDVTCNNITITADTEIFVSFLSEYAWNQNLLGYYHYHTGSVPTSATGVTKNIIFPNLSKPGHEPFNSNGKPQNNIGKNEDAPLEEYMTVKLVYTDPDSKVSSTTFPAGTTIGFWGMINVEANGFHKHTYSLLNWNQWRFFTNSKWNKGNSNWDSTIDRCNFFASGDICTTTTPDGTTISEIIPGIAIYGFKDDARNNQNTAFSTCIFLVSASVPSAMKTENKACFNISCATSPYPTDNIVLPKP